MARKMSPKDSVPATVDVNEADQATLKSFERSRLNPIASTRRSMAAGLLNRAHVPCVDRLLPLALRPNRPPESVCPRG